MTTDINVSQSPIPNKIQINFFCKNIAVEACSVVRGHAFIAIRSGAVFVMAENNEPIESCEFMDVSLETPLQGTEMIRRTL